MEAPYFWDMLKNPNVFWGQAYFQKGMTSIVAASLTRMVTSPGFHKWRYPKMDGLYGKNLLKWMI